MAQKLIRPTEYLRQNPFVLAPMAGITDHAFRTFMRKMGAGVVVSELVSATGIEYKNEKTMRLLGFDETQRPVGLQLFGEDPEQMARAAQVVESLGADFVDLNFGCPVPKVVKKGAGSAMMKDPNGMAVLLKTVRSALTIPLTIKIRTGWDQSTRNAQEICNIAFNEGIEWVAIHGRTRAQGYSGLADWDFIAEVKAKSKLPILGNGDIQSAEVAVKRLKESGCDGVLIGRGALKNPYIFSESMNLLNGEPIDRSRRDLVKMYVDLKSCLQSHCEDHILQIQLKKFAAWYSTGYPNAASLRKIIFQAKTTEEITEMALKFFESVNSNFQEDTSQEEFLMGGHG